MPEHPSDNLSEDPSPLSSSSNATQVTRNIESVIIGNLDPAESATQPILDIVDLQVKMDPSSSDPANPRHQHIESPRSIDMKRNVGHSVPQRISISPQNRPPARSHHRRTQSEDDPYRSQELQQPYYGAYQYQIPPQYYGMPTPQIQPSPRAHQGAPRARRTPHGTSHTPSHTRSRSWNANAMQGLSAAGNPLIPVLQDPGNARESLVHGADSPSQGRRKRSYPDHPGRPRANSASGVPGLSMYGVQGGGDVPPPPPSGPVPQQQLPRFRSERWSPRSEIISLTKGFSTRRPSPPVSPSITGVSNYRSMSPTISPNNPALRSSGHGLSSSASARALGDNLHVQFSPNPNADLHFAAPSLRASWQDFDVPPPRESDALLVGDVNRSKRMHHKMHMRQRSAQLFMEDIKGIPQPTACRDVLFVLLYLFHLVGISFLGNTYAWESTERDQAVTLSYHNVVYMACFCGAFAVVVSTIALVIMMTITKKIIQFALFLTIALSFAWGTIGIGLSPKNFVPITGIIALALSVGYAFVVWDRIPFAASNLHAGLRAVRANMGTVLVAFVCQGIALGWTIYYTFVVIGVYDALDVGDLVLTENMEVLIYVLLGVSFYWTFHVLMNIVQVTVAGTLGSWWFKPDDSESSYWNQSTSHALFSAVFYSIGSICFGSLLIGPVRLIRQLSAFVRPTQEDSILLCLHECVKCVQLCITNCVDILSDRFNPWALTYVGLYGYGLVDAGHNATVLFEKRGWTTIVSDDLVANVLFMFSIVVGGVTGCFGMLLQAIGEVEFSSLHEPSFTAFFIGLGVGLVLTSVLFAIISSSVNAVIVCFAGSPLEFEQNHPELSGGMRASWREVWPGCMDAVDMSVGLMAGGTLPIL